MPAQATGEMAKDIGIGAALTTLMIVVTLQSPIFGFFFTILTPLPTLYYRVKLGRALGAVVPAIALGILIAITGQLTLDLLYFLALLGVGFVLGELFRFRLSLEKTVVSACTAILFTCAVVLFIHASFSGMGVEQLITEYVRKNLEATVALYEGMGMSAENIQVIKDAMDHIQYVLIRMIPALTICSTLFVTWTSLLLARPLLIRRGLPYPDFGPLNRWKAPEQLVWGVIGCGLMLMLPATTIKLVGINGLLVLMTIYFFQGIAIVSFFFEHKRLPKFFRFFLYSLIALQQIFLLLVIGIGFFDIWLDFRKRLLPKTDSRPHDNDGEL